LRCHSEDVVVSWVGQLRAPAPRLSSNPVIEEKACRTGGPSRLLRVVSLDYSARALLWLAKRARDWVRLGSSLAVARRGVGLASRRMCSASTGGFADIFGMPRRWESACTGARACVVAAAGTLVEAPRVRGRRWWERNAIGLVDPASPAASRPVGVGVRRSEKWPRAGRRPIRQLRLWQPSRARSRALASVGRAAASRTIRPLS
jgi:hypothetical protein